MTCLVKYPVLLVRRFSVNLYLSLVLVIIVAFPFAAAMKRAAAASEVDTEATSRAEKTRPEHWLCPVCNQHRSGSGFVRTQCGFKCLNCVAKESQQQQQQQ